MPDDELFELISSQKNMSKKLEEYGTQKSTSIRLVTGSSRSRDR